ncbi:MAG: hypothetical protein AB7L94_06870 [Kofleriaceae bacterium]
MIRFALLLCLLVGSSTLVACEGGKSGDGLEEGVTPAPGGGFCCPIDPGSCDCFRNGGWIADRADTCPAICDLAPTNTSIRIDEHGCEVLTGPESCLTPLFDASVDAPDALPNEPEEP